MRSQLENRLAEAERIKEESVGELEALRKQLDEERSARAAAESQAKELAAELAASKAGADAAAAQLEQERFARAAAESKVEALSAEVSAATAGAGEAAAALEARLRAETAAAEERAAGLATETDQLQKKLQAAQEHISALETEKAEAVKVHAEQLQCAAILSLPSRVTLCGAPDHTCVGVMADAFAALQGRHGEGRSSGCRRSWRRQQGATRSR